MEHDREPLYREVADVIVDTGAVEPEAVAERITRLLGEGDGVTGLRRVRVALGERSYDVVVGHGAVAALGDVLPPTARRAAIVTQAGIPFTVDPGLPSERFEIGAGETHKTLATVESLARGFAGMGLTRNDVVIAVGGGMVTDVAGFAAATWHRGVAVVHVATTLLGMVDAAIGGKTGVNLPEGKNLVGAFWQPAGVLCDLDALDTLPPRERRSGDGEMAKYHFLTGDDLDAMDLTYARDPVRADQGRRRRRRRAGGRAAGRAQLRPHAGARPGDRHRARADPRRGRRHRPGLRRRAGPHPRAHRRRPCRRAPCRRRRHVRPADGGAGRDRRPTSCWR